jgi:hypothetical protein
MKTKHTFGFTFILGLVWTGILFAYSAGPDPGVNGVFGSANTCNASGCHNSFALNSGTGSVAIGGLPTTWTPGQTYDLTVTVSLSGSSRYGFQFSAVNNSTNAQAGDLLSATSNDTRVQFITGSGIEYAQHSTTFFSPGTPFRFRWTAPTSASFGTERFKVAGNATNNDGTSSGDRIYTTSSTVSPLAGDTVAPVISDVTSSSVNSNSATITWTTDEAADTQVEYGLTSSYGSSTTLNSTMVTFHSASLNLAPFPSNTTIHYRVKSRDAVGNLATGTDRTFVTTFAISNLGGVSRISDSTQPYNYGYARILSSSGTTPSGLAIFGVRQDGILVNEAGVPGQSLISSGRIYAEVSADGLLNTGLALANPNPTAAVITFTIRDTDGNTIRTDTTTIEANRQLVSFINQAPFSSGNGIQGSFTFTSSIPVAMIALRGFFNERTPSEFLMTTLPVVDLAAPVSSGTQVIPHFAAGGGWTTYLLLVNPTGVAQTGSVQVLDSLGAAQTVVIDGVAASSAAYTVSPNTSRRVVVTGAAGLVYGPIRVIPTGGGPAPVPLVVFSTKDGPITVSEAGVPVTMGTAFRMYVQQSPSLQIAPGIAIGNATSTPGSVTLTLTSLDGATTLGTSQQALPASGQVVAFFEQMMPALAGQSVQGILRITTDLSSISVVGLRGRTNERGHFLMTTTPPTLEDGSSTIAERVFPHLVNGGGWTTQFVLFSGTTAQTSGGNLIFVEPDGDPFDLNIN